MISFITGIVGIGAVMAVWYAVQALARRQSGCSGDQDMLEGHGCGGCDHSGVCRRASQKQVSQEEGQPHGTV
jgi:hypothetical protein